MEMLGVYAGAAENMANHLDFDLKLRQKNHPPHN